MVISLALILLITNIVVGAGLGFGTFYFWFINRPFAAMRKAKSSHKICIELIASHGKRYYEIENVDPMGVHYSKIFKDKEYRMPEKGWETEGPNGCKIVTFAVHNSKAIDLKKTAVGIQKLMNMTNTTSPAGALAKYRERKQIMDAIDRIYRAAENRVYPAKKNKQTNEIQFAPVETLDHFERLLQWNAAQNTITRPELERWMEWIRLCRRAAKEEKLDAGINLKELYMLREKYDYVFDKEVEESVKVKEDMALDLKSIVRDYTTSLTPELINQVRLYAEKVGEERAGTQYDLDRFREVAAKYMTTIWLGVIVAGLLAGLTGIILLFGPAFMQHVGDITQQATDLAQRGSEVTSRLAP